MSANENDIITVRKHFRGSGFEPEMFSNTLLLCDMLPLLTAYPWGFSDAMWDICSVNLTWQSECSVVNKNALQCLNFLCFRDKDHLFPHNCHLSGSKTFTTVLKLTGFSFKKRQTEQRFQSFEGNLAYLYSWRSTLIHYYVKCICLMKGKSHSGLEACHKVSILNP